MFSNRDAAFSRLRSRVLLETQKVFQGRGVPQGGVDNVCTYLDGCIQEAQRTGSIVGALRGLTGEEGAEGSCGRAFVVMNVIRGDFPTIDYDPILKLLLEAALEMGESQSLQRFLSELRNR